jgi:hypothetical protein
MTSYKGIRAVSSTLKNLLTAEMETQPIDVTLLPPDVAPTNVAARRINLYLYMVTENGNLSNQEIPGEGHPGTYGHPPLSLNLHYLMTGYPDSESGDDRDLKAQEVLGDGMRVLHDFAIITGDSSFAAPELQNEFESVRISLQSANLEEFAKIWTALPAANFRCSVAYNVTVIQIESRLLRRLAAPVAKRRLHLSLMKRPQIESVYRTPVLPGDPIGDSRAAVTQSITITGTNFKAAKTWVKIGALDAIGVVPLPNGNIQLGVPDAQYPPDFDHPLPRPIPTEAQLQPGPQLVEVLVERPGEGIEGGLDRGSAISDNVVQHSNQSVFMLVPSITSINPLSGSPAATLTVSGTRLFHTGLESYVYVNDVAIEVISDPSNPPLPTATSIHVSLQAVAAVMPPLAPSPPPYPVRMQVNGALSVDEKDFTLL